MNRKICVASTRRIGIDTTYDERRPAALMARRSEEVGLLHDTQELLLVHLTVAVAVGLIDHFLELLVGHALPELLGHPLQVLEGNLARFVVIEKAERLQNLVL